MFGGFSSHSRIFHSYGDVTNASEGLQILICARHSWPLSSEGSLVCHTYGASVYNGHLRASVTLAPIAEHLAVELSLSVFLRLRSVAAGIRTSNLLLTSVSSQTNNLTLTNDYVTLNRDSLFLRTNHSTMFSNFKIKTVLTTSKIDLYDKNL